MDVIAGRTLAYYDISQMLANNPTYVGQTEGGVTITNYQTALGAAETSITSALQSACGNTIALCATQDTGEFSNAAANKAFYESTQTYGLPVVYQTTANKVENVATLAPDAGYLLETRFPYLTLQQADDVLTSTEGPGGGFLDNGSSFGVYSRLDLYDAANGYGSFATNVSVDMNAALGGYNAADTWSNNISGAGGFTLNGTGQLTFTGADTYTGPTAVDGGTLVIDGSIVSPVTVNAGGVLAGSGTIGGGATVNSGGTIAPGDDPGTLTADASVRLAAGSTSDFDIDGTGTGSGAANYSRILVNGGSFTAGGTLVPLLRGITGSATNTYTPPLGTQFSIIAATGGVTGSYSGLVQPTGAATGTRFDTIYGKNTITLAVTPASYAHLAAVGIAGETPVEQAVGAALDAGRPAAGTNVDGSLYGPLYGTTPGALNSTLQQFSPEAYGADLLAARDGAEQVDATVDDQLDSRATGGASGGQTALLPNGSTVWISGIGQFLNVDGDDSTGYTGTLGGFAAGIDHELQPGARVGAAIAYLNQTVNVGDGSSASGDTIEGVVYGGARQGILFENLQAGILGLEGNAKRYETAYGSEAQGNFNGLGGGASLRAGAILNADGFEVLPSLALEGLGINRDSLTESESAGAGLDISSGSVSSLQSVAAVKVGRSLALGGMAFTPSVTLGWAHQFLDTTTETTAQFAARGAGFGVDTPSVGRDAAVAGVRAELDATSRVKLFLAYDGAFAANSSINSVTGGVQYTW
jgi:subtilase-type serine protease